mmetsp:Transcript_23012/g.25562  ORF Transcript_23012/g.25562 Transcript_23012/m.25562 type:complete len:135 (+) Transcript_23012:88-492(+)
MIEKKMIRFKLFWVIGLLEIVIVLYSILWVIGIKKVRHEWRLYFDKVPYIQFLFFWFGLFIYGYLLFFEESKHSKMFAKNLWEDILLPFMAPAAGVSIFLYFGMNMVEQEEAKQREVEKKLAEEVNREESKKKK